MRGLGQAQAQGAGSGTATPGRRGAWLRVRRMLRKEFRQMFRDPRLARVIFIAPVIQLIVFGYAVNTDLRQAPTYVVDQDNTRASRELVDALTASGYFRVVGRSDRAAAITEALDRGRALMGVQVPRGFARDLVAGRGAEVQLILDGSNSNTGTIARGNAERIIQLFALERMRAAGVTGALELRTRAWYNPDLASRVYNVPAVIGLILMLMSLLLTALTVVREREVGTLEQLSVTPLTPGEFILGKTIPPAIVAFIDLALITGVAILWFDIPFRGPALALLLAASLYILTGLAFGLLVSTISRTQQEAFMALFLTLMPAIILSGFMFPIFTMPDVFQWMTYANPIRHFLEIVRGVFLKGDGMAQLWSQYLWLTGLAALMLWSAVWRFRRGTEA